MKDLTVIISGGFFLAYQEVLPDFERESGVSVTTLSGASQGTGPKTIRHQLESGVPVDVVIMSREGLDELIAEGRILPGSDVELASVPLAVAVREGAPKPDIGTVAAFRRTLLDARMVVMPGSTSGLFVKDEIFPRLGITERVAFRIEPRGTDSTALLAAGGADLAIGPVSELVDQPGIETIGSIPDELQLVQVFTAAIVNTSPRLEAAGKLTAFLGSDRMIPVVRRYGMEPAR